MSETIKLSFDDGYKNIELNGNPDKIIRINPTDTQFINRISGFDEKYENIRSRYGDIDMNLSMICRILMRIIRTLKS